MPNIETKAPISKLSKYTGISGVELAYAANFVSVIGGIATVVGFFASRSENRKIIRKLDEIKEYLAYLDKKIDYAISQNKEILEKLDQLPDVVEEIVVSAVSEALLSERYATLHAIKSNYLNLGYHARRRYRINTAGWDRLSETITYLVFHENRISKIIELIVWCEFALVASENRGSKVIKGLVLNKSGMIMPLFHELRDRLKRSHNDLLARLESQYVQDHNLDDQLADLDELKYTLFPDRDETTITWVLWCPPGRIPNGGGCKDGPVTNSVPANIKFNKNKKRIPGEIKKQLDVLKEDLVSYCAARDAILALVSYLEIVSEDEVQLALNPLDTTIQDGFEISESEIQFVPMAEE